MISVTTNVHFTTARSGRKRMHRAGPPIPQAPQPGRIPRISKLMALAIRFDEMLRGGVVTSLSDLARLAQVTQPRMTQIMNLLHLAPDIQEQILMLPEVVDGRDPIHEKMLRPAMSHLSWQAQRMAWKVIANR
jgi:hypothetical protein